jgi:hypothetical protein
MRLGSVVGGGMRPRLLGWMMWLRVTSLVKNAKKCENRENPQRFLGKAEAHARSKRLNSWESLITIDETADHGNACKKAKREFTAATKRVMTSGN